MEVTELGMVTEVSLEQSSKACSPMEVTELGMVVFLQPTIKLFVDVSIIALQLLRESYVPLFLSTTKEVSP
jgi:EamA domain-containing membrane protein RarD